MAILLRLSVWAGQSAMHLTPFVFLLFSLQAQGAVFGDGDHSNGVEDQRRPATPEHLKPMGTIFCDGRLRGTAIHVFTPLHKTLTSGSIIVTAAHVLYDPKTAEPFNKCVYRPENKRLTKVGFADISLHQFNPKSEDKLRQAESDIVFIRLKKRLIQPTFTFSAGNTIGRELLLIGYNSDENNISQSEDCYQFTSQNFASKKLLLHDCDANSGASGGAILDAITGGLVGVHGGTLLVNELQSPRGGALRGSRVDPEKLINQARKIDHRAVETLSHFFAYPAKNFQD